MTGELAILAVFEPDCRACRPQLAIASHYFCNGRLHHGVHGAGLVYCWFGPQGPASSVFAIIVVDEQLPGAEFIALVVTCTVFVSLDLHGVTANRLANWMARQDSGDNQSGSP